MTRSASLERATSETTIRVRVELDGTGRGSVRTPIGFLTHMVEQLARHGAMDLDVEAEGDVHVDGHHLTEDLAITLGKAIAEALGDKRGIRRYGAATLPMDEALVTVALDLSGRTYFVWRVDLPKAKIGDAFDTELAEVFFEGFARGAQANLHVHLHEGRILHHIVEVSFKALARAARGDRARAASAGRALDEGDADRMSGPSVLVVDTSMGNLRSVARALARAGAEVEVSADPERVRAADRVVVPGQGAFGDCARALDAGLRDALAEHLARDRPYLGICLGMQILFGESEEAPGARGLGVFAGTVRRFDRDLRDPRDPERRLKVPHMGWNEVEGAHPLLPARAWFYFVHSYWCEPSDRELAVGTSEHGRPFCAAVARGATFACPFHPEKSQRAGAALLSRFVEGSWS